MPQLRHNKITGECVIIAPHRSARPGGAQPRHTEPDENSVIPHGARDASDCPFCPGNEHHIPPVILELNSTARPWQTRVIPNKYPAVRAVHTAPAQTGSADTPVHGHHEVIIESPHHDDDLAEMSVGSVVTVIETYYQRYHSIRKADPALLPILFRNRGARAGASLHHPHSQIIAVPFAPLRLREEDDGAARYHAEHGRCPYCDQIEEETAASSRLVAESEHFVTFVPYAATGSCEIIISPRCHRPDFGDTTPDERLDLAAVLRTAVQSLRAVLGQPDYNYVIRSSVEYGATDPHLHWYLRIVPKLAQPGGFEVATGIPINPSSPEDDAERLRRAV